MEYKLTTLFREFFNSEKAGGLVLMGCTVLALAIANSPLGQDYYHLWHLPLAGKPVEYWINDGLMAIFFLLIGLEIERELYDGELSDLKNAFLPISAALGGMTLPALFHFGFNSGTPFQSGIGIPMATDIAFSLGVLSLLGNRVPLSLKVFLTALAIIDDLGAIIIIALFYSKGFSIEYFGAAMGIFAVMLVLNRLRMHRVWVYLVLGVGLWYCLLHSGVHATISGVLVAFAIPFGDGSKNSPSYDLQHYLHKPVAFVIIPIFALANTGITIPVNWLAGLASTNSLGILTGLVLGKPIGIVLFSYLAIRRKWCNLPDDLRLGHILGAGLLAGIGFTMSIFITLLAFEDAAVIVDSKIAVFVASLLAGIAGFLILKAVLQKQKAPVQN